MTPETSLSCGLSAEGAVATITGLRLAPLEAARSSQRGGAWAPSGLAFAERVCQAAQRRKARPTVIVPLLPVLGIRRSSRWRSSAYARTPMKPRYSARLHMRAAQTWTRFGSKG